MAHRASGTAASLYQAHRAEQRFAQVRDLSNRFIFDFEAAIRDTAGTVQARRMVASTARQYLAELAADAGNNPSLNRELAQSYYRLSAVERRVASPDKTSEWIATLAFRFAAPPSAEADRLVNPLGFQVTSYRIDQEVVP